MSDFTSRYVRFDVIRKLSCPTRAIPSFLGQVRVSIDSKLQFQEGKDFKKWLEYLHSMLLCFYFVISYYFYISLFNIENYCLNNNSIYLKLT